MKRALLIFSILYAKILYASSNVEKLQGFLEQHMIEIPFKNCQRTYNFFPNIIESWVIKDMKIISQIHQNEYIISVNIQNSNNVSAQKINCIVNQSCRYPVLIKKLLKGDIIHSKDIGFTSQTFKLTESYIIDPENLYNNEVKHTILPGKLIKVSDIKAPNIIHKNQKIIALYNKGNLSLKITALALQDGSKGDDIKVKNTKTNSVIFGKIIDENTVLIQ